MASNLVSCKFV